jgi:cytochrome-b5 reductase
VIATKAMTIINRFQFAFLASFVLVFSSLYLTSLFVGGWLRSSGYDISELILIGLPKDGNRGSTMGHVDGLAAEFMNNFQENGYTHVLALVFAVVSSVFIFVKFAYGSES